MGNATKFLKDYRLDIETNSGEIVHIEPPLTIEFEVTKNNGSQPNSANITIYNLGESIRSKLFKDDVDMADITSFRSIQMSAGYKFPAIMSRIFNGSIRKAYSSREKTEYKTVIEGWEQLVETSASMVNFTVKPGATKEEILRLLIAKFPNIDGATIGTLVEGASTRGQVLFGSAFEIIKELTNNKGYVDDNKFYVLRDDEVVPGTIEYVDAGTGLLGTPRRGQGMVEIDMIFEPRLKVGQQLSVITGTEKRFAGTYKVMGFTHRGMISAAMDSPCITTVMLWASGVFSTVKGLPTIKAAVGA